MPTGLSQNSDTAAVIVVDPGVPGAIERSGKSSTWLRIRERLGSSAVRFTIRQATWSGGGYIATQLLRTVVTLVLARHFLGPEPFGLVGLVGVFVAGLAMFSELGIVANIVQSPRGDDPEFLRTAFSIQALRGGAIWLVAVLAAYPAALFYKQPEIFWLLIAAGAAELIRGFSSATIWTRTRHVDLRGITLLTLCSEVGAAAVGILWAMQSPSAWALVARSLTSALIYCVGSHIVLTPRLGPGWNRDAARTIAHFGGWVSIATAAYFLGGQGERLILGKFITAAELGCFSLAVMMTSIPSGGLNQCVNQIVLPFLSDTVRKSQHQAVQDFLRSRRMFCWAGLVTAILAMTTANVFVRLALPPQYALTGWMLQALGMRVALDMFAAPASAMMLAYGQSRYSATANTTRLVLMIVGIWAAFRFGGLAHVMAALLAAQVISYFPLMAGVAHFLPEVARRERSWYLGFVLALSAMYVLARPGF